MTSVPFFFEPSSKEKFVTSVLLARENFVTSVVFSCAKASVLQIRESPMEFFNFVSWKSSNKTDLVDSRIQKKNVCDPSKCQQGVLYDVVWHLLGDCFGHCFCMMILFASISWI